MANLPLAFAELLAGGVLVTAGITDPTGSIANTIRGQNTGTGGGILGGGIAPFSTAAGTTAPSGGGSGGGPVTPGAGYVNPFPGATASRVDQGVDYTSRQFLAPGNSKILRADQTNSGWAGGGYIAGQFLDGPYKGKVWYMAEGLSPTVAARDIVGAGQSIAQAVANPYNQIVGNIEAGWANPANPGQPLAQVSTDKPSIALSWNRFVQALGGPLAHNTTSAGYP